MKRTMTLLLLAVVLTAVSCMSPIALAAEVCYPTAVEQSEDGGEIRKVYDLSPEQDPAGIPRSDFEQDGVHYRFTVRGTAASRVCFRIVAKAVRMGGHWPDFRLQGLARPKESPSASLSFAAFDLCR